LNDWKLQQDSPWSAGRSAQPTRESFNPADAQPAIVQRGSVFRKGLLHPAWKIVARMQYLGKLKRRMFRLLMAGDAAPGRRTPIRQFSCHWADAWRSRHECCTQSAGVEKKKKKKNIGPNCKKDARTKLEALSAKDAEGPLL